jgi:hypothetical protein
MIPELQASPARKPRPIEVIRAARMVAFEEVARA